MEVQSQISFDKLQSKVGQSMKVIIDTIDDKGLIARSAADAPEVDGLVFVDPLKDEQIDQAAGLNPGDFVEVNIIDHSEHDLFAELK